MGWPAGTHYWHSHMDGMQSAKGLRGPIVVKKRNDPFASMYTDERVIVLADEWRDPEVCLKLEGAMAGNDVCSDIDYASMNGQVATGTYKSSTRGTHTRPSRLTLARATACALS